MTTMVDESAEERRRLMTHAEVFAWYSGWSYTDREIVDRHIDRLGVQTFYTTPSENYVGCHNADGINVMYLAATYVQFTRAEFAAGCDEPDWPLGIRLSGFIEKEPRQATPKDGEICPICWLSTCDHRGDRHDD
jgi:hypothetical protein